MIVWLTVVEALVVIFVVTTPNKFKYDLQLAKWTLLVHELMNEQNNIILVRLSRLYKPKKCTIIMPTIINLSGRTLTSKLGLTVYAFVFRTYFAFTSFVYFVHWNGTFLRIKLWFTTSQNPNYISFYHMPRLLCVRRKTSWFSYWSLITQSNADPLLISVI